MNINVLKVLLSILAILLVILIVLIKVADIKEREAMSSDVTEEQVESTYTRVSALQAKMLYEEDRANVVFLDVREKKEYNFKHIPSAINVSSVMIPYDIEGVIKNKKTKIIVYSGRENDASFKAVDSLIELGYKNVYYLTGGISSWIYATI